jgi:hypothetical protein
MIRSLVSEDPRVGLPIVAEDSGAVPVNDRNELSYVRHRDPARRIASLEQGGEQIRQPRIPGSGVPDQEDIGRSQRGPKACPVLPGSRRREQLELNRSFFIRSSPTYPYVPLRAAP